MTALVKGTPAPNFTLPSSPEHHLTLAQFRGQPVILVFYPADWSPVCSDQLTVYKELTEEFQKYSAELIAISVDGAWSHRAFAQQNKFHFFLLSDFEPKGKVAREYGVYNEKEGVAERALFVIDSNGIIQWSFVSPMGVNPGAEGILKALEEMK